MTLHNMLGDLSTDEAVDWLAQLVQHDAHGNIAQIIVT